MRTSIIQARGLTSLADPRMDWVALARVALSIAHSSAVRRLGCSRSSRAAHACCSGPASRGAASSARAR